MKNKEKIINDNSKKNMKTSSKTGFAQIFPCCPPKMGGCTPPRPPPPGQYAPLNETKKDKLFSKRLRSSYLFGWEKKYIRFLN